MLGGIILIYIDAHFFHGRLLPDVSYKVSTSSRSLTQIKAVAGLIRRGRVSQHLEVILGIIES